MSKKHRPVLYFDKTLQRVVYDRDAPVSWDTVQDVRNVESRAITLPRSDVFHLIERVHAVLDGKMPDEYMREHFPLPRYIQEIEATGAERAGYTYAEAAGTALFRYNTHLRIVLSELVSWLQLRRDGASAPFDLKYSGPLSVQFARIYDKAPKDATSPKRERSDRETEPAASSSATQKRAKESDK